MNYGQSDFGPEGLPRHEDSLDLATLAGALTKRRWFIASVFAGIFGAAALYTFLATSLYTAKTVILIERQPLEIVDIEHVMADSNGEGDQDYKTQFDILKSRSLATEVIKEQQLDTLALIDLPQGWRAERGIHPKLVDAYLNDWLEVKPQKESRLVSILFTSTDPELSARVANAHARAYVRHGLKLRLAANREASGFLEDTLVDLRSQLLSSQTALDDFRRRTGVVSFDEKENIVVKRLVDLNVLLTEAHADRIALEAQVHLIGRGDDESLPRVLASPIVAEIREQLGELERESASTTARYRPSHPDHVNVEAKLAGARKSLDAEIARIVAGMKSGYAAAKAKEEGLRATVESERANALLLKSSAIEYTLLEREVAENQKLYETVRGRQKEMAVLTQIRASNVFIIDEAFPPISPSSPRRGLNLAVALILGLLVGTSVAFLLEFLDGTLKTPEDIQRYLGLPSLGVVPDFQTLDRIPRSAATRHPDDQSEASIVPALTSSAEPHAIAIGAVAEAYRSIRTDLLLSRAETPPRTILFTSAIRGEGKTTTTINTAAMFAQLGEPVLLIDADLRRPRCHEVLGIYHTGLTELLTGTGGHIGPVTSWNGTIDFIGSGKTPPNPTELLGSDRMRSVLESLREKYTWILIDAPPVVSVSDAVVLASMVDGVVLVIDSQQPQRKIVREALDRLKHARVLGAVLNRADIRRAPYYYGYQYYGSDGGTEHAA